MENNAVDVAGQLNQAITNKPEAVKALFRGFMGDDEPIIDCGYLGTLGFLLVEHSFWCVTPLRASSLMVKRGGQCTFSSGYLSHINSQAFYQPSLIKLWVSLALIALGTFGIGLLATPWIVRMYFKFNKSGVVFSIGEGIPIYVFADRANLKNAQHAAIEIGKAKLNADRRAST